MLFADVAGSTETVESLPAQATLAILNGAMQRMADLIQARQGRVLRFTGDVALGAGVDADNTAMGVAVNVAARMEQSAPPGALRISFETWSQVRGLFDMEPQPPLWVKGIDAPMVGRDAELQRLLDTASQARETRQLQALTLLGKSRLLTLRSQPDGMLRPWGLLRAVLDRLAGELATLDPALTIRCRWLCQQVLAALGDPRAGPMLDELHANVLVSAANLTGPDDRDRLVQALADFRGIAAAYARRGKPTSTA